MNDEIYEVSFDDYWHFLKGIKRECTMIEKEEEKVTIYSIKTGKRLAKHEGEKFYIFNTPDSDESIEPTPHIKLNLTTAEQVKTFFDFINEKNKERKDDGNFC